MAKILLIDDSIFIFNMLNKQLEPEEFTIKPVYSAGEALESLPKIMPDLILLSVVLPDMDGYTLCRKLKNMETFCEIPIIFVTANSDEQSVLKGFEAGATDYIVKPFSIAELKARISCHLQNKIMADRLRMANHNLIDMMEELKLQSYKDPVTQLYNRRYFLEYAEFWKSQQQKGNYQVFLYLVDIDQFKQINDTYGHSTGDYALLTIANIIKHELPKDAVAIRWGGDEFLLIVFRITSAEADELGERLRKNVETFPFSFDENSFTTTLTVGFIECQPEGKIEDWFTQADKALYNGKAKNGNCCTEAVNS